MSILKLTAPMMHGSAVKRLQEMLETVHQTVGDIDGIFGKNTERALIGFQVFAGLKQDGIYGPVTKAFLIDLIDKSYRSVGDPVCHRDRVVDITKLHERPRGYSRRRKWKEITGVTLHQTGCEMPKNPMGWRKVNAHIGVTQEGKVIILNDPRDFIWHAQGLSKNTIGIEIEGNYPGIMNRPGTLWKGGGGPHSLNDQMMEGLLQLYAWLWDAFDQNKQPWTRVHAHRQSSDTRRADPGEEIWKKVGIPWGRSLGEDIKVWDGGIGFRFKKGWAIPMEWDGTKEGVKY